MSMKWSLKQQAAIDALHTNVLVSASAGAGKTTVLIARLMKRIEQDRIGLDEVVAITFTELAASEMRKRLAEKLSEKADDAHVAAQMSLLPSAYISTIHAFCLKIIQNYAYVLNLDPAFAQNILDESSKQELLDQAFNLAYPKLIQEDVLGMVDLSMHFDRKPERTNQLKEAVLNLASKMNAIEDPETWVLKSILNLSASTYQELSEEIKFYFNLYYVWKIDELHYSFKRLLNTVQNDADYQVVIEQSAQKNSNIKKQEAFIQHGLTLLTQIEGLLPLKDHFDYSKLQKQMYLIQNQAEFKAPPLSSSYDPIKAQTKRFKTVYDDLVLQNFDEENWFSDHQMMRPRLILLAKLTQEVASQYTQLKHQAKALDFDDMEHLAIAILKDEKFKIADVFKAQIKEIMVDEFQDTNEVQNQIVELISSGSNVFRVGDVKQSIYRFRNAQPQLMQRLMKIEDETHKVLYLDENYRSKENIVEFNNQLFKQLMNVPELGSVFSSQDSVKIGVPARQSGGDTVEIHYLKPAILAEEVGENFDEDTPKEESVSEGYETDLQAKPKAIHIVNLIEEMRETTDYKHYKDYVVLVRSNLEKALLKDMFEKANMPHHVSTKSGFFNANAVQDVLLMLKFILNPHEDINFVGLLLSKFIGLSENACATLALSKNNESYYSIFKKEYPELSERLIPLLYTHQNSTLVELLRSIYAFNDYYEMACDAQGKVNLDYLFEKAMTLSSNALSLSEFITRLDKIEDTESSEAIPFTDEDDVVRVMTIHQSKGLEFKVVLYWTRLSGEVADNKSALLADSELGFMLRSVYLPQYLTRRNPVRLAIEMKTRVDEVLEQIRLMYVALTRAVDKLIIIDKEPTVTIPLQVTTLLNALGSTYLIDSAASKIKAPVNLRVDHFASTQTFKKLLPQLMLSTELKIIEKPLTSIEFKTPSSTHANVSQVKLNFNPEVGTNHGTQMHALFENLPIDGWTEDLIKQLQPDISKNDLESVLSFYHNDIYQAMLKGEIKREFAFHSLKDNVVLHGYMDLISVLETEIYLVDYKTDRVSDPLELNELYRDQLLGYAEVLSRMYPLKKISIYAYSLPHQMFVSIV